MENIPAVPMTLLSLKEILILIYVWLSGTTPLSIDSVTNSTAEFYSVTNSTAEFDSVTNSTAEFDSVTNSTAEFDSLTNSTAEFDLAMVTTHHWGLHHWVMT
jgi:hypothetical protein